MGSNPRLLAKGIREPGCTEYRLTIYGDAARELPPAVLIASLTEFRAWIAHAQGSVGSTQPAPGGAPGP